MHPQEAEGTASWDFQMCILGGMSPAVFAVDSMAQPELNLPNELGVLLVLRLTPLSESHL